MYDSEGKGAWPGRRGLQATTRMHTHMHMAQVLEISLWATRAFLSREKIALTGTPSALPIRQICVAFDEHGGKKDLGRFGIMHASSCGHKGP